MALDTAVAGEPPIDPAGAEAGYRRPTATLPLVHLVRISL